MTALIREGYQPERPARPLKSSDPLRCPYPGCVGILQGETGAGEMVVCPTCWRVSARCPREEHGVVAGP